MSPSPLQYFECLHEFTSLDEIIETVRKIDPNVAQIDLTAVSSDASAVQQVTKLYPSLVPKITIVEIAPCTVTLMHAALNAVKKTVTGTASFRIQNVKHPLYYPPSVIISTSRQKAQLSATHAFSSFKSKEMGIKYIFDLFTQAGIPLTYETDKNGKSILVAPKPYTSRLYDDNVFSYSLLSDDINKLLPAAKRMIEDANMDFYVFSVDVDEHNVKSVRQFLLLPRSDSRFELRATTSINAIDQLQKLLPHMGLMINTSKGGYAIDLKNRTLGLIAVENESLLQWLDDTTGFAWNR